MKTLLKNSLFLLVLPLSIAWAAPLKPGAKAPPFSLKGADGKIHSLTDHKDKWVVLEWLNHGCPYVRKHYESKNMQELQKKYTGKGVVWYSVVSSAPGKQGHYDTAKKAQEDAQHHGSAATAVLLDSDGSVGHLYGAERTPDMFVINPKGELAYLGAIDDKNTTDIADVKGADNYVAKTLEAGLANQPLKPFSHKPYGCSIKYQ